ncbi:MAG: MG2 domain-containing protein [Gemmataceae bacterium]|nr:MG2 domain-containing protein [Gemmataceae bacterium]
MTLCDHCRDLVWDYVYDLLEAGQTQTFCAHLAECDSCQGALAMAEAERARLARAARLDVNVPLFVPPSLEPVRATLPPETAAVALRRPGKRWPWLAAAAAILLLVGMPYGVYQRGLSRHQLALREAQARLTAVGKQDAEVQQQAQAELETRRRLARARPLRLQVLGPASYQPGLPSQYQVRTTNLDGQSRSARLTARLVAADGQVLFEGCDLSSSGDRTLVLPSHLKLPSQATARLEVTAQGQGDRADIQEQLRVAEPVLATHLAVAQTVFRPGETVFFRSLTLERFGRKPPEQTLTVQYTLRDPSGVVLERRTSPTRKDGIGGGAFPLGTACAEGEYTLTAAEAEGRFPSQTRRFWVQGEPPARLQQSLQLDRRSYKPGDTIRADFRALRLADGEPLADQPVQVDLTVGGRPVGTPLQLRTDARGTVSFRYPLPPDLTGGAAQLTVRLADEGQAEPLLRTVPLGGRPLEVEFFPEGGDLLAGVPNRVYFRVHTMDGQRVDLEGPVVDSQGREVARVRTAGINEPADACRGLGVFLFLPQAGETYTLRSTIPGEAPLVATLPPARPSGLALHVPTGVTREGEPIRVFLHSHQSARSMLLGLFSGGRLVAQQLVTVEPGGTEVRLMPAAGLAGVLRVTAFDWQGEQLRPVAERLVYRVPAERLVLSVQTDKEHYLPGERVHLRLRSNSEKGQPEPAWLLVSVVHQQGSDAAHELAEPSLPAHFYLATEVRRPEDLEQAEFLLSSQPRAATALDLFLGTQGWRRFRDPGTEPLLARKHAEPKGSQGIQETPILRLDNEDQVKRQVEAAMTTALAELRLRTAAREQELQEEARHWDNKGREARRALLAYEARARQYLRQGASLAVVLSLIAGCSLLVLAVVRAVRGLSANTPYFAGAFASLLLCALMLYGIQVPGEDRNRLALSPYHGEEEPRSALLLGKGSQVLPTPLAEQAIGAGRTAPARSLAVVRMETDPVAGTDRRTDPDRIRERLLAMQVPSPRASDLIRSPAASPPPDRGMGAAKARPQMMMRPSTVADSTRPKGNDPKTDRVTTGPLRDYAYQLPTAAAGPSSESPGTLVWYPALLSTEGTAQVAFDLPRKPATYRILAAGHSHSGRLGVAQSRLEALPAAR